MSLLPESAGTMGVTFHIADAQGCGETAGPAYTGPHPDRGATGNARSGGTPTAVINEVFIPDRPAGRDGWIELYVYATTIALCGYSLHLEGAEVYTFTGDEGVENGHYLVLRQDSGTAFVNDLEPGVDLVLRDPGGRVVDSIPVPDSQAPGTSLARHVDPKSGLPVTTGTGSDFFVSGQPSSGYINPYQPQPAIPEFTTVTISVATVTIVLLALLRGSLVTGRKHATPQNREIHVREVRK
jgi:hypothetical protein